MCLANNKKHHTINYRMATCGLYYCTTSDDGIIIEHYQNINLDDKINDILINKYKISDNIYGELCSCIMTNTFLLSTKTIPVLYVNVIFERPFRKVLLYSVYICFTITSTINSQDELINSKLKGIFHVDLCINDMKRQIDTNITPDQQKLVNFTLSDHMVEHAQTSASEVAKAFHEQYKDEFTNFEIPKKPISLKDYKVD